MQAMAVVLVQVQMARLIVAAVVAVAVQQPMAATVAIHFLI